MTRTTPDAENHMRSRVPTPNQVANGHVVRNGRAPLAAMAWAVGYGRGAPCQPAAHLE